MPLQLQLRRGTAAQNNAFTGALGELTVDTDNKTIRVHDNTTAGGTTLVNINATQTLTNKTLTAPVISTITNGVATLILPTNSDTLVGRTTTDTLANKTFLNPAFASIANGSATITLPITSDTLVGRQTTDTLLNKTLTLPNVYAGGIYAYTISPGTITNNVTIALPSLSTNDTFSMVNLAETMTNKTLTAPTINNPTISGNVNGNIVFQGDIQMTYTAQVGIDITNKSYVDQKTLTTSVALAAAMA